ncbi:hypothetical protein J4050_14175 [Winogradskyella sp. DF17]|uniref:Lipocalin-like domain-containing protein n=1 Tax=Winogradskyella pelagia TaxID=2819984 RepID=A0ABS3T573_9FLAO|nr:hypothetical protein [Winogradskyella sp. DF17]MBO3117899.1 hypothetical protein [Winogradskyella sp. DF17]
MFRAVVLFWFLSFFCRAQQTAQHGNDFEEIIGTWIAEGSANVSRWVFNSIGTMQDYSKGGVTKTYHWEIITAVVGGFKSSYLELKLVTDTSTERNYEISLLTEEKMTLIYQRLNNQGIGKSFTFLQTKLAR